MISKMFYKLKNVRKINRIFFTVGISLLLFSGYFLFLKNGFNQFFIIGTSGLFFLGVSICTHFYEKKTEKLSPRKFICILNFCEAILIFILAIFFFFNQKIFDCIFLAILAVICLLLSIGNNYFENKQQRFFKKTEDSLNE